MQVLHPKVHGISKITVDIADKHPSPHLAHRRSHLSRLGEVPFFTPPDSLGFSPNLSLYLYLYLYLYLSLSPLQNLQLRHYVSWLATIDVLLAFVSHGGPFR